MKVGYHKPVPTNENCRKCAFDRRASQMIQDTEVVDGLTRITRKCMRRGCDHLELLYPLTPPSIPLPVRAWQIRKWKAVSFLLVGLIALQTAYTVWAAQ